MQSTLDQLPSEEQTTNVYGLRQKAHSGKLPPTCGCKKEALLKVMPAIREESGTVMEKAENCKRLQVIPVYLARTEPAPL